MKGDAVAARLRDLAGYAEQAQSPVDFRTLRVELEALGKSLYRQEEETIPAAFASIVVQRRIGWSDTDASGHYHYQTALRLLDAAEAVLHERLGIARDTFGSTPRASLRLRYRRVLRLNDIVDVDLRVAKVGRSSIVYDVEILLDGQPAVEAEVVAVHVGDAGGSPRQVPDAWRELLTTAGPQAPELIVAGERPASS